MNYLNMKKFRAFIVNKDKENKQFNKFIDLKIDDLMEGNIIIEVKYSSLNYKDGLAITGNSPIVKSWPMIPGIDFCGRVLESNDSEYNAGDKVILTGWGVGEKHYGGFSQIAKVKSDWLVKLPNKMNEQHAMIIGSAGLTSMLCVMEIRNILNVCDGDILVTGSSGGVGSFAVYILSKLGYNVIASTGKRNESEYLKKLGATSIIDRSELNSKHKPLDKVRWSGVIDSVGSSTLANAISHTKYGGIVVSTGLAQGADLNTTVFPFILRAVTLKGVESVFIKKEKRVEAWNKLSELIDDDYLNTIKSVKPMSDLNELGNLIVDGKIKGRVVIDVNS